MEDLDLLFVPKQLPDPFRGQKEWTAWNEAQAVALFCGSQAEAEETCKFLNSRLIIPMVYED